MSTPPQRHADARRRGRRGRRLAGDGVARAGRQPARQREHAAARVGGRASACASSPTASRARCAAARRWPSGSSCRTSAAAFYATALKGAQDTLEAAGYHVLVLNTGRAAEREREALRTLRAHQVDGLLARHLGRLRGHRRARRLLRQRARAGRGAGAVAMDNEAASGCSSSTSPACTATERIAYMGPPEAVGTGADDVLAGRRPRAAGGVPRRGRARRAARCRPSTCARARRSPSRRTRASRRGELARARRSRRRRWSAGPTRTPRGCCAGCASAGLRVPEDVALVSFDEPVSADLLDPPMTSLDRHDSELGRIAAETLLRALRGGDDGAAGHDGARDGRR